MSKTLVIHPDDRSTDFLKLIYEDKDYDVITDPNIDRYILRKEIMLHDRIIMLGHGTPQGLINPKYWIDFKGKYPYVIDSSFVELFKTKKTISIWCNSDQFYRYNNISDGQLHTAMIISEVSEQKFVFGEVYLNKEEQLKNMNTFAKAVSGCIDFKNGGRMKRYILKHYKGKDRVTEYNRNSILVI